MKKRKRIKRSTLVPLLLAAYLGVMARIGWPEYASGKTSALYYFGIIAATLVVIVLLHFNLKRREALREQREQQSAETQQSAVSSADAKNNATKVDSDSCSADGTVSGNSNAGDSTVSGDV